MKKKFFTSLLIALMLCGQFFYLPRAKADTADPQADKAALEAELTDVENQIAALEAQLKTTTTQKKTLTNAINKLKNQEAQIRLQIKAAVLRINDLEKKLEITKNEINVTLKKSDRIKIELRDLIKLLQQKNQSVVTILALEGGLAGFYNEVEANARISTSLSNLLEQTKQLKINLDNKTIVYNNQQDEAEQLLNIKKLAQEELDNRLQEQSTLLTVTKGQESAYQQQLADQKKRAAQIRNRIYELFNVSTQITFGQAVQIAQLAEQLTGVRAAFLLAILTQESNLGKNVGTCNRPGDPPEKGWREVMKPERDQEPFLKITTELGMDPDITPVSCPMKNKNGKRMGWGGAMGPAQFIPSTWMGYKDKVAAITGNNPPNPWDIKDAFIAAGIKLKAGGANNTLKGEWNAAMRYFSGSTNTRYRFYGDSVNNLTEKYLADITDLEK